MSMQSYLLRQELCALLPLGHPHLHNGPIGHVGPRRLPHPSYDIHGGPELGGMEDQLSIFHPLRLPRASLPSWAPASLARGHTYRQGMVMPWPRPPIQLPICRISIEAGGQRTVTSTTPLFAT